MVRADKLSLWNPCVPVPGSGRLQTIGSLMRHPEPHNASNYSRNLHHLSRSSSIDRSPMLLLPPA
jgi:hypothetical protein